MAILPILIDGAPGSVHFPNSTGSPVRPHGTGPEWPSVPRQPAEERVHMQLRVVTDQPWDVATDVLAVPYFGEPVFSDALGVVVRRSGGELRGLAVSGDR